MIFILDNYDSFTYNLYQAVATITPQLKVVRNDQISVAQVLALKPNGIIISPGPGRPENGGIGIDLIHAVAGKIPLLGVCLGHQMITQAFGGKVILADAPIHGKETLVFHHRQGIYQNMPLPFAAGRYHSLIAAKENLPACLTIEAESDEGIIMGIKHREFPVYGVQFHPESVLTPAGGQLIDNFITLCQANNPKTVNGEQHVDAVS